MKKAVISMMLIVLILKIGIFSYFIYVSFHEGIIKQKIFEIKLKNTIENNWQNGVKEINLKDVTEFEWEKVYIFQPYTQKEFIDEKLGFDFEDNEESGIEYYDNITLLIFVEGDKVVFFHDLPNTIADLSAITDGSFYKRNEAIFDVLKTQEGWYELTLKEKRNKK